MPEHGFEGLPEEEFDPVQAGEHLTEMILAKYRTQRDFAHAAGVSESSVAKYKKGISENTEPTTVRKWALALDKTPRELADELRLPDPVEEFNGLLAGPSPDAQRLLVYIQQSVDEIKVLLDRLPEPIETMNLLLAQFVIGAEQSRTESARAPESQAALDQARRTLAESRHRIRHNRQSLG